MLTKTKLINQNSCSTETNIVDKLKVNIQSKHTIFPSRQIHEPNVFSDKIHFSYKYIITLFNISTNIYLTWFEWIHV